MNNPNKIIDTNIDDTTTDNSLETDNTTSNLDNITEKNNNISDIENINTDDQISTEIENNENNLDTINPDEDEINTDEEKNTLETPTEEISSEIIDIKNEEANTTNCLALTIQEEHKLVAVKNVFIRSIRMSWKVVVSAVSLAIIKLFT